MILVRFHGGGRAHWEAEVQLRSGGLFRLVCLWDWGDVAEGVFHAWHLCLCLYKILEFGGCLTKNIKSSAWFSMHHVGGTGVIVPSSQRYLQVSSFTITSDSWVQRVWLYLYIYIYIFNSGNILAKIHLIRLCSFHHAPVTNNNVGLWSIRRQWGAALILNCGVSHLWNTSFPVWLLDSPCWWFPGAGPVAVSSH